jgi:hypothetical protein
MVVDRRDRRDHGCRVVVGPATGRALIVITARHQRHNQECGGDKRKSGIDVHRGFLSKWAGTGCGDGQSKLATWHA